MLTFNAIHQNVLSLETFKVAKRAQRAASQENTCKLRKHPHRFEKKFAAFRNRAANSDGATHHRKGKIEDGTNMIPLQTVQDCMPGNTSQTI